MSLMIERSSEKYAKKLIRRADLEDALNRLDKLTYEEAQMATAVQRAIDGAVGGISEEVSAEDDRDGMDDKIVKVTYGEQSIIGQD